MKKVSMFVIIVLFMGFGYAYLMNREQGQHDQPKQKVVDSMEREVMIPARPKRVVFLNASNMELFCAAGGAAEIVGKPTSQALPPQVQQDTQKAAAVGVIHSPDVEKILALKPDLVVGVNVPFHHALISVLEKANIPLYINALDTYEQVMETLRFYGNLTGKEETAKQKIAEIEQKYQAALALGQGKTAPKNLIIWGSSESFSMATSRSLVGDLVKRLGGNNIADKAEDAKGGYVPLSMEYIAKENPEVIFLITHSADEKVKQKFQSELAGHPAWQGIRAVTNQRVYTLPYTLFAVNPGTQVAEAMGVLAENLYPEDKKN